jgi:enamine deaminase RidA (YjgF/YER057c/UK114 family)
MNNANGRANLSINPLNPPTLSLPTSFSHLVVFEPPVRSIYVAGTVGATSAGVVAQGIDGKAVLAFCDVTIAVGVAGATGKDVVKCTYFS